MNKDNQLYVVGPPIKINGKKKVSRIKEALALLNIPFKYFELGWLITIPVPENDTKEFHLLTVLDDNLKYLPADFAERLQEMIYTEPISNQEA